MHILLIAAGDHGKLGHGNTFTQKVPKRVMGELASRIVVCISAGCRHSAAVSEDGRLYTWGKGDFGRLGLGDCVPRYIPTLVADIFKVGYVSCGSAHTLVLSKDGRTVWSFGSGDHGKLGHGDTLHSYSPKVIEALQGLEFIKLQACCTASLALTTSGNVLAWGTGPCTGSRRTADSPAIMIPRIVEFPTSFKGGAKTRAGSPLVKLVDIAASDSHCLAVARDGTVYAWGLNSMGQCGLGHNSLVLTPQIVVGLEGVLIRQISAGTSHSIAWTSPPMDK